MRSRASSVRDRMPSCVRFASTVFTVTKSVAALRAGVCSTPTTIIHLRSIDANDPAPHGWSGPIAPVSLGNAITYVTYWLLTPR